MAHSAFLLVTGCNNPMCKECGRIHQGFDLELQYTDKRLDIDLSVVVQSPFRITVKDITKHLLRLLGLHDISPEHVRLVAYDDEGRHKDLNIKEKDKEKPIEEFGITNDCVMFFEPTENAPPPKKCRLIIIGPDEKTQIDYDWYTAKTTLGMLLNFVIEQFSLENIDRTRIHLITIFNELNFAQKSNRRLSQLDLFDGMKVTVQIIPSLSETTSEEKKDIHIRCTTNEHQFQVDVSKTETINDIKRKIKTKFQEYVVKDFEMYNEGNDELHIDDPDRDIGSFGVKPGQTIYVKFRLTDPKSSSPSKNNQNVRTRDKIMVTVICNFPSNNPETFMISVKSTIDDVIKQVDNHIGSQRLVIVEMSRKDEQIDFEKERSRCLADMGFKNGDIITVTLKDKSPIYSSIVSRQVSASPEVKERSKRVTKKKLPIGLDNLGSSCYMNSALQCLVHVPQLTNQFLKDMELAYKNHDEHSDSDWNPYEQVGDVTGAFAELLWYLWKPEENGDDNYQSFKPSRLKEIIGKKDKRFANDDQQDAQEFMTFFLDTIHEELKKQKKNQPSTIINDLFFGELSSTITCTECHKQESSKHPISFLSIPLDRQERRFWINFISKKGKDELFHVDVPIQSRVENLVDQFSEKYGRPSIFFHILVMLPDGEIDLQTPLNEIPTDEFVFMEQEDKLRTARPQRLELPEKKPTLDDGLKRFFCCEELPDGWVCQQASCKKRTLGTKKFELTKLPTVLIIQFKRFSHENGFHQKVETFVDYPIDGLDLRNCLPSLKEDAIYDLIAVSIHTGSIFSGHYVTFARHIKGNTKEWYRFDDSSVVRVKPDDYKSEIVSRDAYLLFYIKRNLETQV